MGSVLSDPDSAAADARLDLDLLLAEWLEVLESLGRSPGTLETYRRAASDFCRSMEVKEFRAVTVKTVEDYLGRLYLAGRAQSTRRKHQYALRGLFAWLARRGHVPADPTKGIPRIRQRFMGRPPTFTLHEIERLTRKCPPAAPPYRGRREPHEFFERRVEAHNLVEVRDRALIELMLDCALRAGEPGLLERDDFDEAKGLLYIRDAKWSVEIESFPVRETTKAAMSAYLSALNRSRWNGSPALFPAIGARRADSKRPAGGIGPVAVNLILKKRIRRAGIQAHGRKLSPHALRFTAASRWSENRVPIEHIRVLMRHASVLTSQKYIRLASIAKIKRRADHADFFRRFDLSDSPR